MTKRACFYRRENDQEWLRGVFHAWSTDNTTGPMGPMLFPVAVVEDDKSGRVFSVRVHDLSFGAAVPR